MVILQNRIPKEMTDCTTTLDTEDSSYRDSESSPSEDRAASCFGGFNDRVLLNHGGRPMGCWRQHAEDKFLLGGVIPTVAVRQSTAQGFDSIALHALFALQWHFCLRAQGLWLKTVAFSLSNKKTPSLYMLWSAQYIRCL